MITQIPKVAQAQNYFMKTGLIISFKKSLLINILHGTSLKSDPSARPFWQNAAQSTIEYFVLLTVLALVTVVGASTFFPKIQNSLFDIQNAAIERITHADGN